MLSRLPAWLHVTAGPIRYKLTAAATMRSRVPLFTVALALSAGVTACAAIWGFQDAIDRHDADAEPNIDATLDTSNSGNEASTVNESDAIDAPTFAPTEGEAAVATNPFDAGLDATDTDADAGTVVFFQCNGVCAPARPMGWEGPFEISEGDGGPLPGCNAISWVDTYVLGASPNGAPASCSCSCGPPLGVTCSAPVVSYYPRFSDCPLAACATSALDTCIATATVNFPCGRVPHGFQVGPSNATGGSCIPDGSAVVSPIAWGANARLCAPGAASPNGCDPASLCLPTPDPEFQRAFCVVARADPGPCPPAYPVAHHPQTDAGGAFYYADASDQRSCSTCTCGAPAGVTCADASILTFYNSDTCLPRTDGIPLPAPNGCLWLTMPPITGMPITGMEFAGATPIGGTCVPDGGQPQGAIVATAPYTICCTQ